MIKAMVRSMIRSMVKTMIKAVPFVGVASLAKYKFNETSGTTFIDSDAAVNGTYQGSVNLNQAALNNVSGGSVELIADNASYGVITGFDTDEIITSFSISLWVKSSATTIASRPIIEFVDSTGNEKGILLLLADSANAYYPSINVKTASTWYTARCFVTNVRLNTSTAYMLTATFDGSSLKIYGDGVLEDTVAVTGSIIALNGTLMVGKDQNGGTPHSQAEAYLDDLKIYSSVLTAAEILAEYNATKN